MKPSRESLIIHGFAALHAVVTVICSLTGIEDSLLLTLLTMTMTVILCMWGGLTVEFTAINVILVNIAGFILGTLGADFFGLFSSSETVIHALSTLLTTEIIGWILYFVTRRISSNGGKVRRERNNQWRQSLGWLISAVSIVFILRVSLDIILETDLFMEKSFMDVLREFATNSLVLILMICVTVAFILYSKRFHLNRYKATAAVLVFISLTSAIAALLAGYGIPFHFEGSLSSKGFFRMLLVAILAELTFYSVSYVITYAVSKSNEVLMEQEKAHQAEFRYMTLKRQVDPHFLFNSLNILDSLVRDGEKEEASLFTRRLAGIYRYMLRHEGESLVRISEEMEFAKKYYELLKVRFSSGLFVKVDVPEADMSRFIIPCTLQLLIENATKHNSISEEDPLIIKIFSNGEVLCVENNLKPKLTTSPSTGLGMKYITQQYQDASGEKVIVEKTDKMFCVRLPLL
jgi:hypothetical protein